VNDSGAFYTEQNIGQIFGKRHLVHQEIKKYIKLSDTTWKKVKHYYQARCDLIHRKSTISISDKEVDDFRKVVESILKKMFGLNFEKK
jgi:hypothetical protein